MQNEEIERLKNLEEMNRDDIDRVIEMTEDNNRLLKKIKRSQNMSTFFTAVYYILIISGITFSYYKLKPYISSTIKNYSSIMGTINTMTSNYDNLIKGSNNIKYPNINTIKESINSRSNQIISTSSASSSLR